jgi:predicted O-linked N-acetylglucosamine transferase (SPINDLY family)
MADLLQLLQHAIDHHRSGRLAEAEVVYREVLANDPHNPDALHLLGVLSTQGGNPAAGLDLIRQAIAHRPNAAIFHNNLGKALADCGDWAESLASHQRALALDPQYAEAQFNLGVAYQTQGDYVAAEAAYRQTLRLSPKLYKAAHNLGVVLMGQGQPRAAANSLRQALEIKPDESDTHRTILQAILYDPALSDAALFAEHQRFEACFAAPLYGEARPPENERDPNRRLRIGWLSSDFSDHPVARNLAPIFAHRDRKAAEFICYADVLAADATTATFKTFADGWRSIIGRSDAEVVELVRSDRIDILVVLAGRFDRNRPLVAAHRPAPIQVSFHDPATSGLKVMDYLIADPILSPRRTSEQFTERVVRLPSFYIGAPIEDAPPLTPLPLLSAGVATFGSFNSPAKVTEEVVRLWAQVLKESPGSRLLLKYKDRFQPLEGRLRENLAAASIAGQRLEVSPTTTDHRSHLALYNRLDIALDPFPFTGSTTTFEALWMGVPVITMAGPRMAARWSASILHALKLDELIAHSPEEYVAKAVALARDAARLMELRATLRKRLASSPLCNGPLRSRQMERLFRALWRRWCQSN